jgi:3-oxoacyl-[acyl-carrier-protein] synthase II
LERWEHAAARGAPLLAEWVAGGLLSDPSGLAQIDADGASLVHLIGDVLRRGGLSAGDIDYINLHGTGTRANDVCETRAVRRALGAAASQVACSSLKGGIGHLLGAAGAVETAATVLALRDQVVPPTVNLTEPDPECDLDYTPTRARPRRMTHALKLSLGFGGHVAAALLRRAGP